LDINEPGAGEKMIRLRIKHDALSDLWEYIKSLSQGVKLTKQALDDIDKQIEDNKG